MGLTIRSCSVKTLTFGNFTKNYLLHCKTVRLKCDLNPQMWIIVGEYK